MSTQAIIYLPQVDPRTPPMGNFFKSIKHDKHIWQGKEYPLNSASEVAEFNSVLTKALVSFPERLARPLPFLIHVEDAPPPTPSHLEIPIIPVKKRHARLKPGLIPAVA